MIEKLIRFLKTGKWGENIFIGNLVDDALFSKARQEFYTKDLEDGYALFYDDDILEISVFNHQIVGIILRSPIELFSKEDKKLALEDLIKYLYMNSISWKFDSQTSFDLQLGIVTEGNIKIILDFSDIENTVCSVTIG